MCVLVGTIIKIRRSTKQKYQNPKIIKFRDLSSFTHKVMSNQVDEVEVVVVGAGIAGLATSVALRRVGVPSVVLERADGLRATGAALSLFPNAWLALDALGISHKLNPLYTPTNKGCITDVKTKRAQEVGLAAVNRKGEVAGPRVVHRKALLEALAEELTPNTIRFSSKVASIESDVDKRRSSSPSYTIALEDGAIIKAKVVIGCDGVHSVIARKLGLSLPVHSGRSAVRGLAVFPDGHGLSHMVEQFVDANKRVGFVPLNDREVYWFLSCPTPPNHKGTDAMRDPELIRKEVLEVHCKDFPEVYRNVVEHSDLSTLTWAPLMLRYPWDMFLGKVTDGNVTVAGDAMHPMTPDVGQGGGLALEDAVVLGRCIGLAVDGRGKLIARDAGRALGEYVKERRWRAAAVIALAFISGWVQGDGSNWWTKMLRAVFYKVGFNKMVGSVIQYDCGTLPI